MMLSGLTRKNIESTSQLMNEGLTELATAMEQLLESAIDLERIDYSIEIQQAPKIHHQKGENLHIIKRALKGRIPGFCLLIFSESEINKIQEICLPKKVLKGKAEETNSARIALSREIDSHVSSTAIAILSRTFNIELSGDLPISYTLNIDETNQFLNRESLQHTTMIHFKAIFHVNITDFKWSHGIRMSHIPACRQVGHPRLVFSESCSFHGKDSGISPDFIWMFSDKYMDKIKIQA